MIRVIKEAHEVEAFNFGGAWHSDFSFLPQPPSYTLLHAVDVPSCGGDTVFTSMVAALEHLPWDLRDVVEAPGAAGVHTAKDAYSPKLQALHDGLGQHGHPDRRVGQRDPHPPAGVHAPHERQAACCSSTRPTCATSTASISTSEGRRLLLHRLHDHSTDHRFTVRHRWRDGDLVIWDNRATQHLAVNDYGGHRRELHRTTVQGTVPGLAGPAWVVPETFWPKFVLLWFPAPVALPPPAAPEPLELLLEPLLLLAPVLPELL